MTALGLVAAGATMAVAEVTQPNTTSLRAVGPTSGIHGFPVWYEDDKDLRLEQCLDVTDPYCDPAFLVGEGLDPTRPVAVGDTAGESNFPGESFYYQALNVYDLPNGGSVDFTSALEATFAGEAAVDGDQVVFGRIRIRIDGVEPGGTYVITHPYGEDTLEADEEGNINFTEDIDPARGSFGAALGSRVAPFLEDAEGRHTTDKGVYIGNPAEETLVTGSVFGTNYVAVSGPGLATPARNDLFTLLGKVSTNSGVEVLGVQEVDNPGTEQDYVDVHATAGPDDAVQVSGDGVPLTTLDGDGQGNYFARIPVAAFPDEVTVVNASDTPPAVKVVPLTDRVQIDTASWTDGQLTVAATSSDSDAELSVEGFGPLSNGTGTFPAAVPPHSVTVVATEGGTPDGSATSAVAVNGGAIGDVVPQVGNIAGPGTVAMGQVVELDASSSTNVTSFAWSTTGGTITPTDDPAVVTFTAPQEAGPVTITLNTQGPEGALDFTKEITVLEASAETTVTATANALTPEVGAMVTLTADATNAVSLAWEQIGGPAVTLSSTTASSVTFTAPAQPVSFRVTATGPLTSPSAEVTVTPNADQLSVTSATLRTSKNEWRITGTSTVTQLNEVSVYLQQADGRRGALVGTAIPDALGDWDIRNRNLPSGGATRLIVESTKGGLLTDVPFTTRR